jgi:hypothetical protein
VKSTMAYAAKRALRTALTALTTPAAALDGVQVSYAYPARDLTRKVIYFGGVRTVSSDMAAELGTVVSEVLTIGTYIRVLRPDADVEAAETDVETIADTITTTMAADPDMAGGMTWMGIQSANGDYSLSPDGPEAVLSMQVLVGAVLL